MLIIWDDSFHRTGLRATRTRGVSEWGTVRDRWEKQKHSPTVMDSGRPDVGSALESGADCVGGLDSILKHMKRGIKHFFELCHNLLLYTTPKASTQKSHLTRLALFSPVTTPDKYLVLHCKSFPWQHITRACGLLECELRSAALAVSHRSCRLTLSRKCSRVLHRAHWHKMEVKVKLQSNRESP